MDGMESGRVNAPRLKRWVAGAALVASGLVAGGILAGTHIAGAQTAASTSSPGTQPRGMDPATVANGPGETLLTGTTADKVKAAALKAVPGATIIRVETDSAGSPYEAHVRRSDGSYATVNVDGTFTVTAVRSGFGGGPMGAPAASSTGTGA